MPRPLTGCGTALVTPFTRNGAVDEPALREPRRLADRGGRSLPRAVRLDRRGGDADASEHRRVVEITVEVAEGRVPIVAGAGSNDTAHAIALSREMQAAGATHLLARLADVQQAAAARHRRALSRDRRCRRSADRRVQRARPHGEQHRGAHDAGARRASAHRGDQGSVRESGADRREIIRDRPPDFTVLSGDDAITLPSWRRAAKA